MNAAPHMCKSALFVLWACPALYDCGEQTSVGIKRGLRLHLAAIQTPDGKEESNKLPKKLTHRKSPEASY